MNGRSSRGVLFAAVLLGALCAWAYPLAHLNGDLTSGASQAVVVLWSVRVLVGLLLAALAATIAIGGRFSRLSIAFYAFTLSRVAQPPVVWQHVFPAQLHAVALLVAGVVPAAGVFGFVTLCLRMPTGELMPRWRIANAALPFYSLLVGVVYLFGNYRIFSLLIWIAYVIAFAGYLDRRRQATGDELLRSRWVAAGIGAHVAIEAVFLPLNAFGHGIAAAYVFALNPAPFAFAYALVRRRIVDVRVFGGRAVVYALLTSIPIVTLALTDWLFAKQLEDAKLATIVEVIVAVAFSFWLQTLHRRIDRFVERIFFARRHRAHAALEQLIAALPHTESIASVDAMVVHDVSTQLELRTAALYRKVGDAYEKTQSLRGDALPERAGPDDPLVLYARSSGRLVALEQLLAGASEVPGIARAVPLVAAQRTYGVLLYGEHESGEAFDAEEERLLSRIGQAAAAAYEHHALIAAERALAQRGKA